MSLRKCFRAKYVRDFRLRMTLESVSTQNEPIKRNFILNPVELKNVFLFVKEKFLDEMRIK